MSRAPAVDGRRAETLAERAAQPARPVTPDRALAARRLAGWRRTLGSEAALEARLSELGLSMEAFYRLLGESAEGPSGNLANGDPPPWLRELLAAATLGRESWDWPPAIESESWGPLLHPAMGLVTRYRHRFRAGIEALVHRFPSVPLDPLASEALWAAALPREILPMLAKSLSLELHAARLEGRLTGKTPKERYRTFVDSLANPGEAMAFWARYPVLARQVVRCLEQWLAAGLELLARLCRDFEDVVRVFFAGRNPGRLVDIGGGAGDRHAGGRQVHILRFSSGQRLVYKPRPIAAARCFQELLRWLDDDSGRTFRCIEVLDRGSYGWMEWVEAAHCQTSGEVERFYRRLGGYLALLHALEATDFHYENLIAAGEFPVLVDLETLFHPRTADLAAADAAESFLAGSVLRVGLLPQRLHLRQDDRGIDLSGLGGQGGQRLPFEISVLEDIGSDQMRVRRHALSMPEASNRPWLEGRAAAPQAYAQPLLEGFAGLYRRLLARRSELLAPGGPLAAFAAVKTRVIFRPTLSYRRLLDESFHPSFLGDALERDRFFDRLRAKYDTRPHLIAITSSEIEDLWRGDIPRFSAVANSRDLEDGSGKVLADVLPESGWAGVERQLAHLGEGDLGRQMWLIEAALASSSEGSPGGLRPSLAPPAGPMSRRRLLAAARQTGQRLSDLAVQDGEEVGWAGLEKRDGLWSIEPLGLDLYGGLPGVALFLGYLGAVLEEPSFELLARRTFGTVCRRLESTSPSSVPIGAFSGWGGLVYCASHLGTLWHDAAVLDLASGWLEPIRKAIETEQAADLIDGLAGCAAALLVLHQATGEERALAAAVRCGERLQAMSETCGAGIGWPSPEAEGRALAGLAHGVAGIAWVLHRLGAASGRTDFRQTARRAIVYERCLFSTQYGNWVDLRHGPGCGEEAYRSLAWCHGAPGVGLARLASSGVEDRETRAEIEAAVAATRAAGVLPSHCLCHGNLGNLDFLLAAQRGLGISLDGEIGRRSEAVLQDIESGRYGCATPMGVETPGLMTGLAGVGSGLLRLAAQGEVPSVLWLQFPLESKESKI